MINNNSYDFFEVNQPIGKMYLLKMNAQDVIEISKSDTRSFKNPYGIQREIEQSRVNKIADFCHSKEAFFPTPIVLSSPSKYFDIDDNNKKMTINYYEGGYLRDYDKNIEDYYKNEDTEVDFNKFCSIIDGQHRLKGIEQSGQANKFELTVILVLDTNVEQDAYLFSIINGHQKAVKKSLLYDLTALQSKRSVEKMCNTIVKLLNESEDSELQGKIKLLGIKENQNTGTTLTQSNLIDNLIMLISNQPYKDNLSIEQGEKLKTLDEKRYIFRKWFESYKDANILAVTKNYMNAWVKAQNAVFREVKAELMKTNGIYVAFKLLRIIFLMGKREKNATQEYYTDILERLFTKANEEEILNNYVGASNRTEANKLFYDLLRILNDQHPFLDDYLLSNERNKISS